MDQPETREMYGEIASLIASIAQAFALDDATVIGALERGEVALDFGKDANGNTFVAATYAGRTARIYKGAIQHPESA
jgi:hypothetical protein